MENLEGIIQQHPLFADLEPEYVATIAGCAANARFKPGEFLFREGDPANRFFLIRAGKAAVEVHVPQRGVIVLKTAGEGDVVGWSWLFPPYFHHSDGRAVEDTRALVFDGKCLRNNCDEEPRLGYDLMKRFAKVMMLTLRSTRLQLLDLYGSEPETTHSAN